MNKILAPVIVLLASSMALGASHKAVPKVGPAQKAVVVNNDQLRHKIVTLGYCAIDYSRFGVKGQGIFIFNSNNGLVWKLARDAGNDGDDHLTTSDYGYEVDTTSYDRFTPVPTLVKGTWKLVSIKPYGGTKSETVISYSLNGFNDGYLAIGEKFFSSHACDHTFDYSNDGVN